MLHRYFGSLCSGAATEIERVFRGHIGRKKMRDARTSKAERRTQSLFKCFVIQIQRCFRGYYSRRYRANHADRKAFIKNLQETGQKVRDMMYKYSMEQAMREESEELERRERDFKKYAANLHHLVSTQQIRGIFNPPQEYLDVPTWKNVPVEDHVRGLIRDLLRTRGISKTGLVRDLRGSRRVPLKGLKNRLSLQASAPYEAIEMDKSRTKTLHKILTANKGTWFTGGKTDIINHNEAPLSTGDPYCDPWANPLLKRGVPQNQKQLLESAHTQKALFDPPLERPFYTRSGGNKSTALPNDVFDIIAEAEETGGVTQRHLGITSRFGVPESCDNRPPGGILPAPPIRASTLRATRPRVNLYSVKTKPAALQSKLMSASAPLPILSRQQNELGNAEQITDPYASSDDES